MEKQIDIYCPCCKDKGNKPKLLCRVNPETYGVLHLWCKSCKKEIKIELKREPRA